MTLFEFKPMPFPVDYQQLDCCFGEDFWNSGNSAEEAAIAKLAQRADEYASIRLQFDM